MRIKQLCRSGFQLISRRVFCCSCDYDYVEVTGATSPSILESSAGKICGNWNDRIKLLRFTSPNKMQVTFVSDFSHAFKGFKAEVLLVNNEGMPFRRVRLLSVSPSLWSLLPRRASSLLQFATRSESFSPFLPLTLHPSPPLPFGPKPPSSPTRGAFRCARFTLRHD